MVRRGRPRKFEYDRAIDACAACFFSKGFHQTTLDDLANASGLHRPSIYLAFGSKEDIYRKVAARYRAGLFREIRATLYQSGAKGLDEIASYAASPADFRSIVDLLPLAALICDARWSPAIRETVQSFLAELRCIVRNHAEKHSRSDAEDVSLNFERQLLGRIVLAGLCI